MRKRSYIIMIGILGLCLSSGCAKERDHVQTKNSKQPQQMEQSEEKESITSNVEESGETNDSEESQAPEHKIDTNETIEASDQIEDGIGKIEVVLPAHVKEIRENMLVISSEADDYPGAFIVEVPEDVSTKNPLSGGDSIIIRMIDLNKEEENMEVFQAESISPNNEDKSAKNDILLTEAPDISLNEALSSKSDSFKLYADNSEWSYKDQGKMETVSTCGFLPLDENADRKQLNIPDYNKIQDVLYLFNTSILPDHVSVHEWKKSDIGNEEAEPISTIEFYTSPFFIELKKDRIYEIVCTWNESNVDINGCYGTANYVFVTK